jgi:hypothetical protein
LIYSRDADYIYSTKEGGEIFSETAEINSSAIFFLPSLFNLLAKYSERAKPFCLILPIVKHCRGK